MLGIKNKLISVYEKINCISCSNKTNGMQRLLMTLVCKDEIDIIESNIRFHIAMGIDGIIVTDNGSTDGTRERLQKLKQEGLILEIIDEKKVGHLHSIFVNKMMNIAIHKYKADWVINADADEFYFSKTLNLKDQLPPRNSNINVLKIYSNWVFPLEEQNNVIDNIYFVKRAVTEYEKKKYQIVENDATRYFMDNEACPKTIIRTKGFIDIFDGNHYAKMKNYCEINPAGITLYHYHTRSYEAFEKKVVKAIKAVEFNNNPNWAKGWKMYIKQYRDGNLKQFYEMRFGKEIAGKLIDAGVVVKDPMVYIFMKERQILF